MAYGPPVWDIEDLVTSAKRRSGCPYFAAKLLAENADIVFCPYNYLIDPSKADEKSRLS